MRKQQVKICLRSEDEKQTVDWSADQPNLSEDEHEYECSSCLKWKQLSEFGGRATCEPCHNKGLHELEMFLNHPDM